MLLEKEKANTSLAFLSVRLFFLWRKKNEKVVVYVTHTFFFQMRVILHTFIY